MLPRVALVRAPNPGPMTLEGTNSWVVGDAGGAVVIDPGPADADHVGRLVEGRRLLAVVLTHRHADHSHALPLLEETLPVFSADPLLARRSTALRGGERLRLQDVELEIIATPGHTDDSVCALLHGGDGGLLFTGDTLLGGRTGGFVSRQTGSLEQLLASLERLSAYVGVPGLPGHGETIDDVGVRAAGALAHRRERLDRLDRLLREDPAADLAALVRARHPGSPERQAHARWMLRTELEYLDAHGRLDPRFLRPGLTAS